MFERECEFLLEVEEQDYPSNRRSTASASDADKIIESYPGIPDQYIAYLREIGFGSVREDQYWICECPDWCDKEPNFSWFELKGRRLLVFGGNSSGDLYAFDVDNGFQVCELLHETMEVWPFEGDLRSFLRREMLLSSDGTDMRVNGAQ